MIQIPSLKSLSKVLRPRTDTRIFGVGAAKTGTHSIGEMFSDHIETAHEADAEELIRLHLEREITGHDAAIRRYLWLRDRKRHLKIDSSQVNIYLIDDLERLFPGSLYVMTVRHPLLWLRSMMNDSLRREISDTWHNFRDYRFGSKASAIEEQPLGARGLYSLEGYLGYWKNSIERVDSKIAPERLLVIKTNEISAQVTKIADFCGIAQNHVAPERTKSFANPLFFGVLRELDPEYLIQKTETICGDMARCFFPDYSIKNAVADINSTPANS